MTKSGLDHNVNIIDSNFESQKSRILGSKIANLGSKIAYFSLSQKEKIVALQKEKRPKTLFLTLFWSAPYGRKNA